ncbi:uncharacterized protein LOC143414980 [Maylandia zebra]|uniref:uncharacterized protein LOC143414980 n=1 Tax=Maylandia zebra TaxID=106582 RepID=UPI00403CD75B
MVLLWMIPLVLLLCAEAENMPEVRDELGTNVTLTCSNQTSDPHWYMEIHSQFRACINRRFSSADSTYCSPDFETKFLILGNKLVIKNLTAEDCRLYFCAIKRGGSIQFVETFRLVSEAENVTEVGGELGTNVTLTCSNQTSDPYWYMEIYSQFRAGIGRSFSSADSTYYSPGFETKFLILGNKLVIKSLTAEDCRLYFCGIKRGGSIQFVETFRVISDVTLNITDPQIDCRLSQLIIICVSVTVVVFVILGAVFTVLCLKRKSRRIQKNNVSLHIYENTDTLRAAQNKVIQSQRAKAH